MLSSYVDNRSSVAEAETRNHHAVQRTSRQPDRPNLPNLPTANYLAQTREISSALRNPQSIRHHPPINRRQHAPTIDADQFQEWLDYFMHSGVHQVIFRIFQAPPTPTHAHCVLQIMTTMKRRRWWLLELNNLMNDYLFNDLHAAIQKNNHNEWFVPCLFLDFIPFTAANIDSLLEVISSSMKYFQSKTPSLERLAVWKPLASQCLFGDFVRKVLQRMRDAKGIEWTMAASNWSALSPLLDAVDLDILMVADAFSSGFRQYELLLTVLGLLADLILKLIRHVQPLLNKETVKFTIDLWWISWSMLMDGVQGAERDFIWISYFAHLGGEVILSDDSFRPLWGDHFPLFIHCYLKISLLPTTPPPPTLDDASDSSALKNPTRSVTKHSGLTLERKASILSHSHKIICFLLKKESLKTSMAEMMVPEVFKSLQLDECVLRQLNDLLLDYLSRVAATFTENVVPSSSSIVSATPTLLSFTNDGSNLQLKLENNHHLQHHVNAFISHASLWRSMVTCSMVGKKFPLFNDDFLARLFDVSTVDSIVSLAVNSLPPPLLLSPMQSPSPLSLSSPASLVSPYNPSICSSPDTRRLLSQAFGVISNQPELSPSAEYRQKRLMTSSQKILAELLKLLRLCILQSPGNYRHKILFDFNGIHFLIDLLHRATVHVQLSICHHFSPQFDLVSQLLDMLSLLRFENSFQKMVEHGNGALLGCLYRMLTHCRMALDASDGSSSQEARVATEKRKEAILSLMLPLVSCDSGKEWMMSHVEILFELGICFDFSEKAQGIVLKLLSENSCDQFILRNGFTFLFSGFIARRHIHKTSPRYWKFFMNAAEGGRGGRDGGQGRDSIYTSQLKKSIRHINAHMGTSENAQFMASLASAYLCADLDHIQVQTLHALKSMLLDVEQESEDELCLRRIWAALVFELFSLEWQPVQFPTVWIPPTNGLSVNSTRALPTLPHPTSHTSLDENNRTNSADSSELLEINSLDSLSAFHPVTADLVPSSSVLLRVLGSDRQVVPHYFTIMKSVMIRVSDFFHSMLSGPFAEAGQDVVEMVDLDPKTLGLFLDCLNSDATFSLLHVRKLLDPPARLHALCGIHEYADRFLVDSLRLQCEYYIFDELDAVGVDMSSILQIFLWACAFDHKSHILVAIQLQCRQKCLQSMREVVQCDLYKQNIALDEFPMFWNNLIDGKANSVQ